MTRHINSDGFTLLELCIVMMLIGVILSGGLVTFSAYMQSSQYNTTVARMDAIEQALLDFAAVYRRIPCPADLTLTTASANYGLEPGAGAGSSPTTATGVCYGGSIAPSATFSGANSQVEGGIPTRALQLPDTYMFDGWGKKFSYAVDPTATATNALPVQKGVAWCGAPITVNDSTGAARSTTAIYAIISHGASGHGAYTSGGSMYNAGNSNANKLTNCHCTSAGVANVTYTPTYVAMTPTVDSTGSNNNFDDIVTFKEPWQLQSRNLPLSAAAGTGSPMCIYVENNNGGTHIEQYNSAGTLLNTVGCYHAAPCPLGTLLTVGPMALDSHGNLWAADQSASRVNEFALASGGGTNANCPGTYGGFINRYGSWGTSPTTLGHLGDAGGVAVDMYGNIWVSDSGGARIQMLNLATGTFVGQVGCDGTDQCTTSNTADGQLAPTGGGYYHLAFDKNNNLWVTDNMVNVRVQEFTINYNNVAGGTNPGKNMGTWVQTIGGGDGCAGGYASSTTCTPVNGNPTCCAPNAASCTCGASSGMGNFTSINGIAIDPDGTSVWVVDGGSGQRIQKFTISGSTSTLVQEIGGAPSVAPCAGISMGCVTFPGGAARCNQPCTSTTQCTCAGGSANGTFNHPFNIAFDPLGNLWVVDQNNSRVQEINPAIAGINATGGYINGVSGSLGYIGGFAVPGAHTASFIAVSR